MAKHSTLVVLTTATLVVLFVVTYCSTPVSGVGGMVGGRTKIKDVKTNKDVQELGRYSVEEYNLNQRRQHKKNGVRGGDLTFAEVVEAEKQVVSGIKYYMKISATIPSGVPKTFDAVVVVKPWVHSKSSKELLSFAPSPATK